MKVNVLVVQSCLTICDPMECSHQAPLNSTEFSKQEYWSGLPFPSSKDLGDPGIGPGPLNCRQILYHLSHHVYTLYIMHKYMSKNVQTTAQLHSSHMLVK